MHDNRVLARFFRKQLRITENFVLRENCVNLKESEERANKNVGVSDNDGGRGSTGCWLQNTDTLTLTRVTRRPLFQ